jgi:hypothetical protein
LAPQFNVRVSEEKTVVGTFTTKGEAVAECKVGEQVVSGGVFTNEASEGFSVGESAPATEKTPPGWKVVTVQTASGLLGTSPPKTAKFRAYAICSP